MTASFIFSVGCIGGLGQKFGPGILATSAHITVHPDSNIQTCSALPAFHLIYELCYLECSTSSLKK
jgi:hypothetical protein